MESKRKSISSLFVAKAFENVSHQQACIQCESSS